jgi:hypothetical protein
MNISGKAVASENTGAEAHVSRAEVALAIARDRGMDSEQM